MTTATPGALVSTAWLETNLAEVKILDCTWHHVSTRLDGRTQYRGRHLPRAVHFDIEQVADRTSPLPHMLPKAGEFAAKVGLLGIGNDDHVVVYDRLSGGSAAARAWWMFRTFGHDKVSVLDGGYVKWLAEKRATEMSPVRPEAKSFAASFQPRLVRDLQAMKANLLGPTEQVIDTRGPAKFAGTQEDVFPHVKLGHIPGSLNLPWADLIEPESGAFVSTGAMAARFAAAKIDLAQPIVVTCASGTTSCVVALGLYLLGCSDVPVYDGGWAEWGMDPETPAEAA